MNKTWIPSVRTFQLMEAARTTPKALKRIAGRRIFFLAFILMAGLSAVLAGCTDDTYAPAEEDRTDEFRITVTDSSYHLADEPDSWQGNSQSRATENGYQTVFTDGDRIGFYSTKDKALVDKNICLTMINGLWTPPEGVKLSKKADYFFAYYPYQESPGNVIPSKTNETFFGNWVTSWRPKADQSDQGKYSAQDLMLGTGALSGNNLKITLKHQMGLIVIQLPANSSGHLFSVNPFPINGTFRYLIPIDEDTSIQGLYHDDKGAHEYSFRANIPSGMYQIFKID